VSTLDWPACTFYEELMERHPEAKVLLSVQDPERWYRSTRGTIHELTMLLDSSPTVRMIFGLITLLAYGGFAGVKSSLPHDVIWQGTFGHLRRAFRGRGLRHRGLRAAQRGGEAPRPARAAAGL
jgi:hypothetical protein